MRGISTLNLLLKGSLFASALFFANQASAQIENTCLVVADFNTDNNGFSSTPPNGFEYFKANGEGYYQRTIARDFNDEIDLVLTSPTYRNPYQNGVIYYGFSLSGYVQGTTYTVEILDANTNIVLAAAEDVLVNSNPNANAQNATICNSINDNDLVQGAAVKYRITIHSPDPRGNGNVDVTVIFDNFSIGAAEAIILPVDIASFKATKSTRGVQLAWTVANEVNVSRYEVLKGSDASNLKPIGIVFAGEKSAYSFTDEQPSQGISFYRLRSVDIDGKFKLSTVISFSNGKSTAILRAYPMPARNEITLQHGAIEGKAQISITSESGQIMKRVVPATGSMQTSIDLSTLKAGLYLLRLENSNGEVETLKVVKQ